MKLYSRLHAIVINIRDNSRIYFACVKSQEADQKNRMSMQNMLVESMQIFASSILRVHASLIKKEFKNQYT